VLHRVESDGALILNELRLKKGMALNFKFPNTNKKSPSIQAASGATGIIEGVDYRGVEVLADVQKNGGTNWLLVSKIDKDEILAVLNIQLYTIFGISLGLILVVGVSLMLLYPSRQKKYLP
jgi:hypothetical protein